MSQPRLAAVAIAATAVALTATTAVASAATNPVISKEATSKATTAPVAIAGVKKGARLSGGERLVFRTVTLTKGQRVSVTLRAPAHMTLRGLAAGKGAIRFTAVRPSKLVGQRSVTVRVSVAPNAKAGKHTGRIWALVR